MMEVILTQPVEHLGHGGDVVKVANGYARNYLLPRKLAVLVTEGNKRQIEHMKKLAALKEAEERGAAETLSQQIAKLEITIRRRVGERDTLYGSVTSADIAEAMAAQNVPVDRRKIQLPDPLKHLGEHDVPVKLHRDVTARVRVTVAKDE